MLDDNIEKPLKDWRQTEVASTPVLNSTASSIQPTKRRLLFDCTRQKRNLNKPFVCYNREQKARISNGNVELHSC